MSEMGEALGTGYEDALGWPTSRSASRPDRPLHLGASQKPGSLEKGS